MYAWVLPCNKDDLIGLNLKKKMPVEISETWSVCFFFLYLVNPLMLWNIQFLFIIYLSVNPFIHVFVQLLVNACNL